eukprot:superscaffoldBa00000386_g4294
MDLTSFRHTLWDILRTGDSVKIKDAHGAPGSLVGEDPHLKAADRVPFKDTVQMIQRNNFTDNVLAPHEVHEKWDRTLVFLSVKHSNTDE